MFGRFDLERRRAKRVSINWAKRLVNPSTVRLVLAVLVGITNVIAAFYRLIKLFRD
jgi:hypothetical protein